MRRGYFHTNSFWVQTFFRRVSFLAALAVLVCLPASSVASDAPASGKPEEAPILSLSKDMDDVLFKEAAQVTAELKNQVRILSQWTPLGWDLETLNYLYKWTLTLPLRMPELIAQARAESRALGIAGSLVMLIFIAAVLYSLIGRARVMRRIESALGPERTRIPEAIYPYFIAALRVVVAAAIPLLLLGLYSLITAMIIYQATWFTLTGRLLGLWAAAALALGLLREFLTGSLFPSTTTHGRRLFWTARIILLYLFIGIALFWGAEAFHFRNDVLAFLRFALSVLSVFIFLALMLQKKALMSLLPDLPYQSYRGYVRALNRLFYPLVGLSFVLALLWCFGFQAAGRALLAKIWFTVAALVALTLVYHGLRDGLQRWSDKIPATDEHAQAVVASVRSFLIYAAGVTTGALVLNLLGLLEPVQRILSFPLVTVGGVHLSFWILLKGLLIIFFFILGSRLIQGFLDYKAYPAMGVHPGTGFAVNTIIHYSFLGIGTLIALDTVGVDLRLILVFAGAIGIGIGLGLQNMAASMISGFTIIFGGKVRKGDWIEVEGNLGEVVDISVLSTRIRTRQNVEYLIPNSNLISNTIINYSLSSPMIWTGLNVGVSYGSDPREVERILLEVAGREPMVSRQLPPRVLFTEFADSSLNFRLLVWIDARRYAERLVHSALYFAIFEEFKKAGIEIPFPQRDIHIRTPAGNAHGAHGPTPEDKG
jgi:small-conductance mechanosensitive channel